MSGLNGQSPRYRLRLCLCFCAIYRLLRCRNEDDRPKFCYDIIVAAPTPQPRMIFKTFVFDNVSQ